MRRKNIEKNEYFNRLSELPPSAKLVAKILEDSSGLTKNQLKEESLLARRTLREALKRLNENGLIDYNNLEDTDSKKYYINTDFRY